MVLLSLSLNSPSVKVIPCSVPPNSISNNVKFFVGIVKCIKLTGNVSHVFARYTTLVVRWVRSRVGSGSEEVQVGVRGQFWGVGSRFNNAGQICSGNSAQVSSVAFYHLGRHQGRIRMSKIAVGYIYYYYYCLQEPTLRCYLWTGRSKRGQKSRNLKREKCMDG